MNATLAGDFHEVWPLLIGPTSQLAEYRARSDRSFPLRLASSIDRVDLECRSER